MLDIRQIRREPELVKAALARRGVPEEVVDRLVDLDARRRDWITRSDDLKKMRNEVSAELGRRRKAGEDISEASARMREVGAEIASLDAQRAAAEDEQQQILDGIPNLPDASVPDGRDAQDNVVVRTWGEPRVLSHPARPHWEVGEELGILDFKRSAKLSGSRFWLLKGDGARLERALISFMLELHTSEHRYTEILPPSLVTRDSMYATGQLPKFEEDLFRCTPNDLFLIPTSEVPLTNLHREGDTSKPPNFPCATPALPHASARRRVPPAVTPGDWCGCISSTKSKMVQVRPPRPFL